jgi:hypothetical protein
MASTSDWSSEQVESAEANYSKKKKDSSRVEWLANMHLVKTVEDMVSSPQKTRSSFSGRAQVQDGGAALLPQGVQRAHTEMATLVESEYSCTICCGPPKPEIEMRVTMLCDLYDLVMAVRTGCQELQELETPENMFLRRVPAFKMRVAKGSATELSMRVRRQFYLPSQEEQAEDAKVAADFIRNAIRKRKNASDPIPPVPHPKAPTFVRSLPAGFKGLVKGVKEQAVQIDDMQPLLDIYHERLTEQTDTIAGKYQLLDGR